MKHLIILLLVVSFSTTVSAQAFYVHCADKKSHDYLEYQIKYHEYKTCAERDSADFTIECMVRCTSKLNSMYKGAILVIDNSTKDTIYRTKEVRRGAVAVNGYNASYNIFRVISKRYLPDLLSKCKTYAQRD